MSLFKKCILLLKLNGVSAGICYCFYKANRWLINWLEYFNSKIFHVFELQLAKKYQHSDELNSNESLRNRHVGKEAVLIATGPSVTAEIQTQNFQNKVIITVNEGCIYLNKINIVPDYIVINDHAYFDEDKGFVLIKQILEYLKVEKTKAVFPISYKAILLKNLKELPLEKIFFYHTFPSSLETVQFTKDVQFDFTKPMPSFPTVTHCALVLSLFLGCKKTYLLGVDIDYVITSTNIVRHCYDDVEGFDKKSESCLTEYKKAMNWSFEELLKRTQEQLQYFKIIKKLSVAKNQVIINASNRSCLEEFVFGDLS